MFPEGDLWCPRGWHAVADILCFIYCQHQYASAHQHRADGPAPDGADEDAVRNRLDGQK